MLSGLPNVATKNANVISWTSKCDYQDCKCDKLTSKCDYQDCKCDKLDVKSVSWTVKSVSWTVKSVSWTVKHAIWTSKCVSKTVKLCITNFRCVFWAAKCDYETAECGFQDCWMWLLGCNVVCPGLLNTVFWTAKYGILDCQTVYHELQNVSHGELNSVARVAKFCITGS